MTPVEFQQLQEQLWSAFGPLISWWLAFFGVGTVVMAIWLFGAVFFSEWVSG